jgi:hypothetical protein
MGGRTEVGLDGLLEGGELAAAGAALLEHGLKGPRDEASRGARHGRGGSPGRGGARGGEGGNGVVGSEDARSGEREAEEGRGVWIWAPPSLLLDLARSRGFQRIARTIFLQKFLSHRYYFALTRSPTKCQTTGLVYRRFGACAPGFVPLGQTGQHVDKRVYLYIGFL